MENNEDYQNCVWAGQEYSHGASICVDGYKQHCSNGQWVAPGLACKDFTEDNKVSKSVYLTYGGSCGAAGSGSNVFAYNNGTERAYVSITERVGNTTWPAVTYLIDPGMQLRVGCTRSIGTPTVNHDYTIVGVWKII